MAKTKRITLSLHRKISDDNYGSFGAELTEEVELEEGDKRSKVLERLRDRMEEDLNVILLSVKPKDSKKKKG